jgi:hypothetical protein
MSHHGQEVLRELMAHIPITQENGVQFYEQYDLVVSVLIKQKKFSFFTVAPDLRKYFKGSENVEPSQVATNERF